MARLACLLLVVFCVGAVSVRGDDDPWFPWWSDSPPPADSSPPLYPTPDSPSPYYDAPPYMDAPPSYPPPDNWPPTETPEPSPWSCSIWAVKTDTWPSQYQPDTPIGDVLGDDAVKVYGQVSMLDGLTSKGDDGYSDLLKQGIAAVLNAVDAHFKYTEDEIKKCFDLKTALSSEAAATVQANDFEAANDAYNNSH